MPPTPCKSQANHQGNPNTYRKKNNINKKILRIIIKGFHFYGCFNVLINNIKATYISYNKQKSMTCYEQKFI